MIIKGKKVILRPTKLSDAPQLVRWLNSPEINKLLRGGAKQLTLKEEKKWIRNLPKKKKTEKSFAIETNQGILVGSGNLHLDLKNRSATFGIGIDDKRYWNQGLGTEASKIIIDYGFRKLKLHRISLDVYSYNKRAVHVYKKLGFKTEGVMREGIRYKGRFYDNIQMSILDREWRKK